MQIAAKKMPFPKKTPLPFPFKDVADAEGVVYDDDVRVDDVSANKSKFIAANKIKNKYKKMRAKNKPLPFNLGDIAQAETESYVDDVGDEC